MSEENRIVEYQAALEDIKQIIISGQKYVYQAANRAMVFTYWQIGKRIVEQEQKGEERAEYGKALLDTLSDELTRDYGKSYSKRNLQTIFSLYIWMIFTDMTTGIPEKGNERPEGVRRRLRTSGGTETAIH